MDTLRSWFERHLSDPQVVLLALLLLGGLLLFVLFGGMLAPVIAAMVIAYVLDAPAETLRRLGLPNRLAVTLVFVGFLSLILFSVLALFPLLSQQLAQLVLLLPNMIASVQEIVLTLPERYPDLIAREQVVEMTARLQQSLLALGQGAVLFSVDRIGNLLTIVVYLFLVPLMVFFFLKDKVRMQTWATGFLPAERGLVNAVWSEVDHKTGAYIRGKSYEVALIGAVTWVAFTMLDLEFATLLAALTGLSVLVPYLGVAAVSLPVGFVALFQFGLEGEFFAAIVAYVIIQLVDGNLLAPLLISEVVDIHPIAVIASILIFGGIWGFWGVFFAIPLATLAMAVINAWPKTDPAAPAPAD